MKITIVQGAFLPVPPVRGGAVERVWFGLGKTFAARGHEVTHFSRSFPGLPSQETIDGVRHIRRSGFEAPGSMVKLKCRDLQYSLAMRRALPAADILVTNTFFLPMLIRNRNFGRLCVHVARLPKGQMKFYRHADRLQAVSTVTAEAIAAECPSCAPLVRVLPNHLDDQWFVQPASAQRDDSILYVGRIHPEKGLDILLEATAKLSSHPELRIVGPWESNAGGGGEEYFQSLKKKACDLGLSVEWVGPIYDVRKLVAAYDRSSTFVYPSVADRGETFGVAPLEAMARGCVTVLSDLKCFRDFARPGENCLEFKRSEDAAVSLAKAIENAMEASKTEDMRKRAQATAAEFHLEKVATKYLDDFEELMQQ
ncbi:MAG TPA: glycosyltransferase family 4 protein [Fimbriimonadaceae bacterium]|nr:glycosyltransferase family 4 protein [Fimbriimonadaceae bacterium]